VTSPGLEESWRGYDVRVVSSRDAATGSSKEVGADEDVAFDAALERLRECAARIQALVPELHAAIERRAGGRPRRREQSIYIIKGRGPSVFAPQAPPPEAAKPGRVDRSEQIQAPQTAAEDETLPAVGGGSPSELFMAAELAFAGRSREEIREHLRAQRGPGASVVIADAFE
jgi:hypothetical protein